MHLKSGIIHAVISKRKLKHLVFMRWQFKKTDFTASEVVINYTTTIWHVGKRKGKKKLAE